jgi:8-oxo-dGTP diphosphatase
MNVNEVNYPYLFGEHTWAWGPVKTVFNPGMPPLELVSNINIVPYDNTGWLIVRHKIGWWGIVGGTLEPNETYHNALERELIEEAGCKLIDYKVFGALRMEFFTDKPYRSHLPFPISYRLLAVGEVKQVTSPTNPDNGEQIVEVGMFPLKTACQLLETHPDDGPLLADIYKFAAAFLETYDNDIESIR